MEELMLKAFWSQCALCKALALHGHCVTPLCPNSRCPYCGTTQLTDNSHCDQHKPIRNLHCLCCQTLDLQAHYAMFEDEAVSDFLLPIDQYYFSSWMNRPKQRKRSVVRTECFIPNVLN